MEARGVAVPARVRVRLRLRVRVRARVRVKVRVTVTVRVRVRVKVRARVREASPCLERAVAFRSFSRRTRCFTWRYREIQGDIGRYREI